MPDLIAQGVEAQQRWRRTLPEAQPIVLGRLGGVWAVPWDHHVSRRHVSLLCNGNRLEVARLPDARNRRVEFALIPEDNLQGSQAGAWEPGSKPISNP